MSSLDILKSTGFNISKNNLLDEYPQLTEKMVVDLVNGIEVIDDHIKISNQRSDKFSRIVDSINGTSKHRQKSINTNLTEGLKATYNWLKKHEGDVASVNMATIKLGDKLLETRRGVMKLKSKHDELSMVVDALANSVQKNNEILNQRIQDLDYRSRAEKKLKVIFDAWRAGNLQNVPLYFRVYQVLDTLKNNDFGLYLMFGEVDKKYKTEMLKNLQDNLLIQVSEDLGLSVKEFTNKPIRFDLKSINNCTKLLINHSPTKAMIFNYLSDWSNEREAPSTNLLHKVTNDNQNNDPFNEITTGLEQTFNMKRWFTRMAEEQFITGA